MTRAYVAFAGLAALAALGCSCERKPEAGTQASSAAASGTAAALPAPVASGLPGDLAKVSHVVNPKNEAAYSGPVGTVLGTVTVSGDPPPEMSAALTKIPSECPKGREYFGMLFREGPGRALADALVTVTGYQGYVPDPEPAAKVDAQDCFWGSRTVALTFGQRIEARSRDNRSYVPELVGSKMTSQLVATPFGKGVANLFPPAPGRYVLVDNLRLFMTAEVLVLKYATHDVTGGDGRFEIRGIPPGKVMVSAFLPQTGESAQREVELKAGEPLNVDLVIPFNAAKYQELSQAAPGARSAAPAPSAH